MTGEANGVVAGAVIRSRMVPMERGVMQEVIVRTSGEGAKWPNEVPVVAFNPDLCQALARCVVGDWVTIEVELRGRKAKAGDRYYVNLHASKVEIRGADSAGPAAVEDAAPVVEDGEMPF